VAAVKAAVSIPVIVNGDIRDGASARAALQASGADGLMLGRGATGRPWIASVIEAALGGRVLEEPGAPERWAIVAGQLEASLAFYGDRLGVRMFRKHLAAYVEQAPWPARTEERRAARGALCRLDSPAEIRSALAKLWLSPAERLAA